MSALDAVISFHQCLCTVAECTDDADARAELAALYEKINELAQRNSEVSAQRNEAYATIAEQARQLEEAREIIKMVAHEWTPVRNARAWIAANAPAPQAQSEQE